MNTCFESETLPRGHATAPTPAPFGKPRQQLAHWYSILGDKASYASERANGQGWKAVRVPHNWDDYHGYRVDSHGNQHGTAWYQTSFIWEPRDSQERVYAFFEGVGSYADVYANGRHCGSHAGGRTTFTVDLTPALQAGENLLAVRAHHPEGIDDLPFVCGGCWGAPNTEGTQPFGMSRPAWLEYCGPVRIEPFGVHMLTPEVSKASATVASRVTVLNPDGQAREIRVNQRIYSPAGSCLRQDERSLWVEGEQAVVDFTFEPIADPELWCPASPALHLSQTEVYVDGKLSHQTETTFGLRWLEWPTILEPDADHNTFCSSRHGEIISTGLEERTASNNGLTNILEHAEESPARLAPMGVVIEQRPDTSAEDRALLLASITIDTFKAGQAELFCEVQNDGGTIFFHQWQQHLKLEAGRHELKWDVPAILHPHRWREIDPYLHRLIIELRSPEGVLWGAQRDLLRHPRAELGPEQTTQPRSPDL